MTTQEAKEILLLYRPGTADSEDPAFAEALELCERDAELNRWFQDQCSVYQAIRSRLRATPAPEGLQAQILSERKINASTFWRVPALQLVVASLAVIAVGIFLFMQWRPPSEDKSFSGFREQMISTALRSYGMDLVTENPEQVRAFLVGRKAISDYVVPTNLSAKMVGCVATTWQGRPVSMICFRTGKPLQPGHDSDLWLFITESASLPGAPSTRVPRVEKVHGTVTAASWKDNGKTYVLASESETELLKFL